MKIVIEMEIERETQGAILYKGRYNDAPYNVYVKKRDLPSTPPAKIRVTIEA